MIRQWFCLLVFSSLGLPLLAANTLKLVVPEGQPGRIDQHQVDLAQIQPGGSLRLQVVVEDLDFVLAGAEFVVDWPQYLMTMSESDSDYRGEHPPIKAHSDWGTPHLLVLPVDEAGHRTAERVNNAYGAAAMGILVKLPGERPVGNGSTDLVLVELEFTLNNANYAHCISAESQISLIRCNHIARGCDYFADENGDKVIMGGAPHQQTVITNNSATGLIRGDANLDGALNAIDFLDFMQCSMLGQAAAECRLGHLTPAEFLQVIDFNCDGGANGIDASPFMNYVVGSINNGDLKRARPGVTLPQQGVLAMEPGGVRARAAVIAGRIEGAESRIEPELMKRALSDQGWQVDLQYDPQSQALTMLLLSEGQPDADLLPLIPIPVQTIGPAKFRLLESLVFTQAGAMHGLPLEISVEPRAVLSNH